MKAIYQHEGRVRSLNAERSAHWSKRAKDAENWREAYYWLGKQQRVKFGSVHITAEIIQKRPLADCGNGLPSIKAAIDGLIDASVLVDDSPEYVRSITMVAPRPPQPGEVESLIITLEEAECA
jgi:crossover junction endodeoxyribonuclease RusA